MPTDARATEPLSEPLAFRPTESQRAILEAFRIADGCETLTPILREALGYYLHARIARGREAVRLDRAPTHREGGPT